MLPRKTKTYVQQLRPGNSRKFVLPPAPPLALYSDFLMSAVHRCETPCFSFTLLNGQWCQL